jgi:type II secretory pathway pseudopilin PulG
MSRFRRSRPAQPESGFTIIEVVVAMAITFMVLVAAADLLGQLMTTTTNIERTEKARMVAYQVAETARTYQCGAVFGSEANLGTLGANCANGFKNTTGVTIGTCATPTTPAPLTVFGDTKLCWTDGTTKYGVAITTWWEISKLSSPACPASGAVDQPDTLARRIVVQRVGSTGTSADKAIDFTARDAAPVNPPNGAKFYRTSGTATVTVNGSTITHTGQSCTNGGTLFPRLPASGVTPSPSGVTSSPGDAW